MNDDDYLSTHRHIDFSNQYNQKYKNHPLMNDFASDSMVMFLYGSNALEGTLPECKKGDTFPIVRESFKRGELFNINSSRQWDSEGRLSCQERDQIFRHFNAKQALDIKSDLNLEIIKRVHFILMSNSTKAKKPVKNGEFRTGPCFSSGTWKVYPPHQCIEGGLSNILSTFNQKAKVCSSPKEKIEAATELFYDVVSLHPFEDGNGRLGRILLSYALERMGTPFPVLLTTGHSRSKNHVINALKIKDKHYHHDGLFAIVASSLADQWQSFFNYIRFFNDDV